MSLSLNEIDAILNKARQKREYDKVAGIDAQIETLALTIETYQNEANEHRSNLKSYQVAKEAADTRLTELVELKDQLDKNDYESARQALTQKSFDAESEIEDLDRKLRELEIKITASQKEAAELRVKKDQIIVTMPTPPKSRTEIPQAAVAAIANKEKKDDELLLEQVRSCGLANKTRGLRLAVYGGHGTRPSAQTLQDFLLKILELKSLNWYICADGRNDADRLMASIKNGGTDFVLIFDHMASQSFNVKSACKAHHVNFASCMKVGKATVLQEVAKVLNIIAPAFVA